jgi:hypothetical protein
MNYRQDTLDLVTDALTDDMPGLEKPEAVAEVLIHNLLAQKSTVVCSLPKPMLALLRCLHETGLWGCTVEEVLERLAADQLRAIMVDKVKGPEWFPGGVANTVDAYGGDREPL